MIHKMKLNESPFERIKNGTKTIEFNQQIIGLDILTTNMKLKGYKMEDVNIAMKKKVDKKGSFNNRIYLEYVDEKSRNLEEEKELNKDFRK